MINFHFDFIGDPKDTCAGRQVDKTSKRGVSIYWSKHGLETSLGAKFQIPQVFLNINPVKSHVSSSIASSSFHCPILRWEMAKEAGRWVPVAGDEREESEHVEGEGEEEEAENDDPQDIG